MDVIMNCTLHPLLPVVGDLTFTHAKVRSPTTGSKDHIEASAKTRGIVPPRPEDQPTAYRCGGPSELRGRAGKIPAQLRGRARKFQHALEFRGSRPQAHMQDPVESTRGTDANAGVLACPAGACGKQDISRTCETPALATCLTCGGNG